MSTITIYWQALGWFVLAFIVGILGFAMAVAAGDVEDNRTPAGAAVTALTFHVLSAVLVGIGVAAWHP